MNTNFKKYTDYGQKKLQGLRNNSANVWLAIHPYFNKANKLNLTLSELSELTGMNTSALSRGINSLVKEGIIFKERKSTYILDSDIMYYGDASNYYQIKASITNIGENK